jgi:hypothetical protein
MKPEVARFVEEMLRLIRREFFAKHTDKRFFQERTTLIEAITWPARCMNILGARLPASGYRRILGTVIDAIKRHGNRAKIQRFSVYFLHSVEEHMKHHGDEYYYASKAARPIGAILPAVMRNVRPGPAPDRTTEIMSQMNQILRSSGGRRRRIQNGKNSASAPDLFNSCTTSAARMQKGSESFSNLCKSGLKPPKLLKSHPHGAPDS